MLPLLYLIFICDRIVFTLHIEIFNAAGQRNIEDETFALFYI